MALWNDAATTWNSPVVAWDSLGPSTGETLFGTTTPGTIDSADATSNELGVVFKSSVKGIITGIRFYKASTNTGTHTGRLWTAGGSSLGTASFVSESASGWQQADFASPISIAAGTVYIASYSAPNGHYSVNNNYFTADVVSGHLTALSNANAVAAGLAGDGLFVSPAGTVPTSTFQSSNYWVDVVFTATPANSASFFILPMNPGKTEYAYATNVSANGAICTIGGSGSLSSPTAYTMISYQVNTGSGITAGTISLQVLGGDGTWRSVASSIQPIASGGTIAASTPYTGSIVLGPVHGVQLLVAGLTGGNITFAELGATKQ